MLVRYLDSVGIHTVNPYSGCSHGCVYCIANSAGISKPIVSMDNAKAEVERAIEDIDPQLELSVGAIADAYPPVERDFAITREVLKALSDLNRPFCINTKSDIVCRDVDILMRHPGHCDVYFSIASLNETVLLRLEPGAPPVRRRLKALWELHNTGVLVGADISPFIPGITDVEEILEVLPEGIHVQLTPLDVRPLEGRVVDELDFTEDEILHAYLMERDRVGDVEHLEWKVP